MSTLLRLAVCVSLGLCAPALAGAADLTPERVQEAIDKGVVWLKAQQRPDGSFSVGGAGAGVNSPGGLEAQYPLGTSALAALTLLKCGVEPDDPAIGKVFDWMYAQPLQRTYEVAMLVLAIEARFMPSHEQLEKEEEKKGYATIARKQFGKKARPVDQAKLKECADWLIGHRAGAVWRYPGSAGDGSEQDHSCAQYAMLALKSCSRLGCKIPDELWEKVADHFVAQQDPSGEEVPWFQVPAADGLIQEMVPPAKRVQTGDKDKKDGGTRVREGGPPGERPTLHARGWSYLPRPVSEGANEGGTQAGGGSAPPPPPVVGGNMERVTTGSMTASGIAALVIAKSELEGSKSAWSRRSAAVDRAIRDGCAWLARYFIVDANPTAANLRMNWGYYYLYGCERAGVLAGTYRFGTHDWYDEGAAWLLGQQQTDGAWPAEAVLSSFADSCFALLFLRRATIPLVPLPPKRVMTGTGGR